MKHTMRLLTLVIFGTAMTMPAMSAAKGYRVQAVDVEVTVQGDGSIAVVEDITYRFDGSFSKAFRDIPLKSGEEVADIVVSEGGRWYSVSQDQSEGTYSARRTPQGMRVEWSYRANNETRTFTLAFTATGVVRSHADVAELYYQFVGDRWDRSIGSVTAIVRFSETAYGSDLRAWAHGPLHGTVDPRSDGTVVLSVSPLPAYTYWEGRVTFPPQLVPGLEQSSSPMLATIMAEEAAWAEEANDLRERRQRRVERRAAWREKLDRRAGRYFPIAFVMGFAVLGLWFAAFRTHGMPHRVQVHAAPGEIPSDHRPAIVSYLVYKEVGAGAIVATLVDLAERGYFNIREEVVEKSSWFGKRTEKDYVFERTDKLWSDMESFELALVEFLITEVGDMNRFSMLGLKKTARKNRSRFLKWFQSWIKSVKEAGKQHGFFEPYPTSAMWRNALAGFGVLLCGIFFCAHSRSPAGTPAIIGGLLALILTGTLNRRTIDGQRLANGWRGFKEHIKAVSKGLGPVTLDSHAWSRYLGAAIIFGMHKKLLPKLHMVDESGHAGFPVWYYAALANSSGSPADGIADFADGLSSMVSSVTTTMSSASGTGGGASGGGGGGSGGGGGGAS
jgi:uncharacterized membrane protein